MSHKKQTAVEYLTKEFSEILGKVTTTPLQDLLLVDAITIAKEKAKQQIIDAYMSGTAQFANDARIDYPKTPEQYYTEQYYNETYER
jgi:hypothetical protein